MAIGGMKMNLRSFMNNSIKDRILFSFGAITTITIIVFEILFVFFLHDYYYGGVEQILKERTSAASEFLNKYRDYSDIDAKSNFLFDTYLGETDNKFLVQTIRKDLIVVGDSFGATVSNQISSQDIEDALNNKISLSIETNAETKERTMSASRPLIRYSNIDGVVRYTVSLSKIDEAVNEYTAFSVSIAFLLIMALMILLSLISQTIVDPIQRLNTVAIEMANGNFEIRAPIAYDDEIGQLANTLNYMANEIGKNEGLKKDFVSSISHELRTPLTSIKGWGETLLYTGNIEPDSDLEIGLKIITSEADRLKDMVEELLDFSKLESHQMKVYKRDISIRTIVKSVYSQMLPRASGIDFKCIFKGEDTLVNADANRLRQVFINLVANSIKFANKENPEISLTVEGLEDKVVVEVKDNGIGISEENIGKVKEKFYKENVSSQGGGIGLALVDEIVKLHEGEMIINSKPGEGTRIEVVLPTNKLMEDTCLSK